MITRALCLLLLAGSLGAQAPAKKSVAPTTVMGDLRKLWQESTDYLVRSAAAMPESTYAFQPTPAVRTFGQLIGHVAGTQNTLCALALGEKAPAEDEIEKSHTTKASLVQALKESNDSCVRAYAQGDAAVGRQTVAFGERQSRRAVLMLNTTHNFEHYGNVITYMRMNGMVPPSSQPTP